MLRIKLATQLVSALVVLVFLVESAGYAQQMSPSSEDTVRQVYSKVRQQGTYSSWDEKQLGVLGDDAAVELTKILSGDDLSSKDIEAALTVIQLTFAEAARDEVQSRQHPRTTMFLLHSLECFGQSAAIRQKVVQVREFVSHQTSIAKPQSP